MKKKLEILHNKDFLEITKIGMDVRRIYSRNLTNQNLLSLSFIPNIGSVIDFDLNVLRRFYFCYSYLWESNDELFKITSFTRFESDGKVQKRLVEVCRYFDSYLKLETSVWREFCFLLLFILIKLKFCFS